MLSRLFVASLLIMLCVANYTGPLYGTYTADNTTFGDLNLWVNNWNGPDREMLQSVRILEIGWGPQDTVTAAMALLEETWTKYSAVPIVTWMPYAYSNWTSPTPNADIVNGQFDSYIDSFLQPFSKFLFGPDGKPGTADDRRAYLRFAPQPNGNWFPWSPDCPPCGSTGQAIKQTAQSYVDMWKYVMGKVRSSKYGITSNTLLTMFAVNNADAYGEPYKLEDFFPGSSQVDWLAVTGVNWGDTIPGNQWSTPSQVFDDAVKRLVALKKAPVMISGATTSHPQGAWPKYFWITSLFEYATQSSSPVKMLLYHNQDSSTDLAFFGGEGGISKWNSPLTGISYNLYQSYADAVNNKSFAVTGSHSDVPRLISDNSFTGNF